MAGTSAAVDADLRRTEPAVPGFEASPARLRSTRAFVDRVASDVSAEVSAVQRDVEDLLGSGWTGSSANAFARGWQDWTLGARSTLRALEVMAELLGVAGRDFADGDVLVGDSFAKFAS